MLIQYLLYIAYPPCSNFKFCQFSLMPLLGNKNFPLVQDHMLNLVTVSVENCGIVSFLCVVIFFVTLTFFKYTDHMSCAVLLSQGFSNVSSDQIEVTHFFGRNTTDVILCPQYIFPRSHDKLICSITGLRWCLPGFFIVKQLFSLLPVSNWQEDI